MKEAVTKAVICLDDDFGFTYRLCDLEYIVREDDSYVWNFRPDYAVMDLLPASIFQGIPGLDLDQKKEIYVRENKMPVFITERAPTRNREDLWQLMEEVDLDYYDPLEWLLRSDKRYSGDNLYVKSPDVFLSEISLQDINSLGLRSSIITKQILKYICSGTTVNLQDCVINDSNRKVLYKILYTLYAKEKKYVDGKRNSAVKEAKKQGKYKGRKKLNFDILIFTEVMNSYKDGKISEAEGMKRLGVSRSTFERRYKEFLMRH